MRDRRNLTRRDFLNGVALGVAAGGSLSPLELLAAAGAEAIYPPALTGMRGSQPGSFEVAHALAWSGATFPRPDTVRDDTYDLVVVGGGISGLSAAFFYRQQAGPDARILVLDNHDDFGGHARRNEFDVDGTHLIGYGGSQALDGPGSYSPEAKQLLVDLGIDVQRFYEWHDQEFMGRHGLQRGIYFDKAAYGRDSVAPNVFRYFGGATPADLDAAIDSYPLPAEARDSLRRLLAMDGAAPDPLPGLSAGQKADTLQRQSYLDWLQDGLDVHPAVAHILRDTITPLWGVGWDALSALEAWRTGMPGFAGLGLPQAGDDIVGGGEPYIFHFPDGNAAVARALVRALIPEALAADDIESFVTTRADYAELDVAGRPARIRLNSTAVDVRHVPGERLVDVTYVRDGASERVQGRHVVLACYNQMIPYLCPELPGRQREALEYAEKVPLVYLSIAVRNWQALADAGYYNVHIPSSMRMNSFGLDFPVSIGDYRFASSPEQPTVLHGSWVPTAPDRGLTSREQHLAGRRELYTASFDEFEADVFAKLDGALGAHGFDAGRDIAGLTVNRWPHGYAYEYNDLSDPDGWGPGNGPHVAGRAQIGRISIANSDASAYAYVDGAIDAAYRAVAEQLRTS